MTSRPHSVAVDTIAAVAFTLPDLGTRGSILFTPTELMASRDEAGGLSSRPAKKPVCTIAWDGGYVMYLFGCSVEAGVASSSEISSRSLFLCHWRVYSAWADVDMNHRVHLRNQHFLHQI